MSPYHLSKQLFQCQMKCMDLRIFYKIVTGVLMWGLLFHEPVRKCTLILAHLIIISTPIIQTLCNYNSEF